MNHQPVAGGRDLARFVTQFDPRSLDAADIERLTLLVMDHLGVALRGMRRQEACMLRKWASRHAAPGATILLGGSGTADPSIAAFVNAAAAHTGEMDDTHDESLSHPGAVVIATALALAPALNTTGLDFLAAIAMGYEVMARTGMAVRAAAIASNGFHPTGVLGGFGAAATAARLFRLPYEDLLAAWGLVLSAAGGSMQFSEEASASGVKQLHAARAAQEGIRAVDMVMHGIRGPIRAIEGRYGACQLFGGKPDFSRLDTTLSTQLQIHQVTIKLYPSCRMCHSAIDALRQCTDNFTLDWKTIERIQIFGPAKLLAQHMQRRPQSMSAAQYSLPYTVAAALRFRGESIEPFEHWNLNDEETLTLLDKVAVVLDPCLDHAFPAHLGSKVALTLTNGTLREATVLDSRGTPWRPLTDAEVTSKFTALTSQAGITQSHISQLETAVRATREAPNLGQLQMALASANNQ
ncbi:MULTISPECIES: MmgE/PrpD family protein [unclassified Duganella]|uniref:MmgE/PrpD family protein n=1 Tax=unclassified Duganella TaxID=2636909 RepID=UPI001314A521|nr:MULTISPECIES: MmgE/PrpD family protein [unclassified Duganella]